MASNIGAAMSGTNGSGGTEEEEDGEGNGDGNVVAASGGDEKGKRGGGGIFGKLLFTKTMAQGKERGGGGVGGVVETDGEGGFLTTVASKIGAAMAGSNGSGGAEEEQGGECNGDGDVVAASGGQEKGKRDGNGGGGTFSKLMSDSPDSLPASVETEEDRTEGGERAGILSTVASKIGIAMSGSNGHASHGNEDDAKISNGDATDHGKTEEKGDGPNGGGIVKQLR